MVSAKSHYRRERLKKHLTAMAHLLQEGEKEAMADLQGAVDDWDGVYAEVGDDASSMAVDQ